MPRELTFEVDGLTFAAQEWGIPGKMPVLALHGWLDNSASFNALAPRLSDVHLIALDMAGHGQSSHRPGSAPYNIWEDVAEIFAIADKLQWERFTLLGHSRGAIISMLAAGTFPERISRLALIEGLLPEPARVDEAPQQLANSILRIRAQAEKPLSIYPDLVHAIKARERGFFPLSYAAAAALTERGVKGVPGGYQWSTDQRLLAPSAIKLTREHVQAFITRITAPIKLILAESGIPKMFAGFQREVSVFPTVDVEIMPGGHHLHMENEVEAVAASLNRFFAESPHN
jgi:pimeloyl-ACP methyl ester carboxylesterase